MTQINSPQYARMLSFHGSNSTSQYIQVIVICLMI